MPYCCANRHIRNSNVSIGSSEKNETPRPGIGISDFEIVRPAREQLAIISSGGFDIRNLHLRKLSYELSRNFSSTTTRFAPTCFDYAPPNHVSAVLLVVRRCAPLYFDGGGVTGKSELNMSSATLQLPSACFFQTVAYLPRSVIGLPLGSFIVNS